MRTNSKISINVALCGSVPRSSFVTVHEPSLANSSIRADPTHSVSIPAVKMAAAVASRSKAAIEIPSWAVPASCDARLEVSASWVLSESLEDAVGSINNTTYYRTSHEPSHPRWYSCVTNEQMLILVSHPAKFPLFSNDSPFVTRSTTTRGLILPSAPRV